MVILITGDGSFQMNIQELATAVINKIDIKIFIMNNNSLGMVRQLQQLFFKKRYFGVNLSSPNGIYSKNDDNFVPDFSLLAKAYNLMAIKLKKLEDMENLLEHALNVKGTVIVNCIIGQEENVYPIIPPNASLDEMIEEL